MTLDTESWTEELKQIFGKIGNSFANSIWEATYFGSKAGHDATQPIDLEAKTPKFVNA